MAVSSADDMAMCTMLMWRDLASITGREGGGNYTKERSMKEMLLNVEKSFAAGFSPRTVSDLNNGTKNYTRQMHEQVEILFMDIYNKYFCS